MPGQSPQTLCIVIGDPIRTSLSHLMHTSAYRALGIADRYSFVPCWVPPRRLADALAGARGLGIRGVSVTMPHKESVVPLLDDVHYLARRIGAVNTIVNDDGELIGYNTDGLGIVRALEEVVPVQGLRVALLGSGGAARAAACALGDAGAKVTVFCRNLKRGAEIAALCHGSCNALDRSVEIAECTILINATPVGMPPDTEAVVIDPDLLRADHIVFDMVYAPHETRLLREAAARGARTVHGLEMLLYQGATQFELYTSLTAPLAAMRDSLVAHIGSSA